MNKKISVGITISLMVIASALTFILTSNFTIRTINNDLDNLSDKGEIYKKIGEIDKEVKANFFGSIDQSDVLDAVAEGYLTVLGDKYASYNSFEENEERNLNNDGSTIGLGMTYSADESGYIVVDTVLPNSPAQLENIQPGMLIVAVNGQSVISLGYNNALNEIKGEIGTNVLITFRNEGQDREVALTRSQVEIRSVSIKMINDIAVISISEFNYKTKDQFNYALEEAKTNDAKGIIFDLRNNLGGLLTPCLEMLDIVLPEGVIATSTNKLGEVTVLKESDTQELDLPIVTLVNSRTASAGELFAGALRDFDKTQLVGVTTYGKGVMQNTYQLSDGSSITFTVGTFQTPLTPNIDGVGLKPDYEVVMVNDSASELTQLDESTDFQLRKALDVITALI